MTLNPFKSSDDFRQLGSGLLISSGVSALIFFLMLVKDGGAAGAFALVFAVIVLPMLAVVFALINACYSLPVYHLLRSYRLLSVGSFLVGTAGHYLVIVFFATLICRGELPAVNGRLILYFYGVAFFPMAITFWIFSAPGSRWTGGTGNGGPTAPAHEAWDPYGPRPDVWDRNRV